MENLWTESIVPCVEENAGSMQLKADSKRDTKKRQFLEGANKSLAPLVSPMKRPRRDSTYSPAAVNDFVNMHSWNDRDLFTEELGDFDVVGDSFIVTSDVVEALLSDVDTTTR